MTKKKLIILDRDGVINRDLGDYVKTLDSLDLFPNALSAIASLKKHHYQVAIATNQAGIAKAQYSETELAGIHAHLIQKVREYGGDIDQILYCPSQDNNHPWRKPNPQMLLEILKFYKTDGLVYFIGDTLKDVEAALKAGINPIVVQSGKPLTKDDVLQLNSQNIPIFTNLEQFVENLLEDRLC